MAKKKHYCLVIDDDDQTTRMDSFKNIMKQEGINIDWYQINPKNFLKVDTETGVENFEEEAMFKTMKDYLRKGVQMVVCDNGLGIDHIFNGYQLIYLLRTKIKYKNEVVLYSGNLEAILNEIFDDSNKAELAKRLVKCNIKDFLKRDTYTDNLKHYFKNLNFNIQQELIDWLHTFKNHTFQGHPLLERKTLGQIVNAIEEEKDLGVEFQKLFVEQGISTMIKLNNLPQNE